MDSDRATEHRRSARHYASNFIRDAGTQKKRPAYLGEEAGRGGSVVFDFALSLKRVPHAQLHHAGRHRGLEFAKLPGVIDIQNGVVEIHMIEGVECLCAQRYPMAL